MPKTPKCSIPQCRKSARWEATLDGRRLKLCSDHAADKAPFTPVFALVTP